MIEDEVFEILRHKDGHGGVLNEMADQFRRGRDARELIDLLDSDRADVVSIGLWILNDLPFKLYNRDTFLLRLRTLLAHSDSSVRFHALGALFPAFNANDPDDQALLRKLRNDPNEGVRGAAEAAAARLGLT